MLNAGVKFRTLSVLVLCLLSQVSFGKEGMWLPVLLKAMNQSEMETMGLEISAEDIYSVNKSSMKDAVVLFGGGCTGEIVSDQGLLFTNHHCGHSFIQKHSTLENNIFDKGFWAQDKSKELACEGLKVTLIVKMVDVTAAVLGGVDRGEDLYTQQVKMRKNLKKIQDKLVDGTHYKAVIKPFYYGNQYYAFITETFEDVRLVGAPPETIGTFGGDTDNWVWPRHTGDFSVFRIYANADNQPAPYSENNVPYRPKHHFPISLKGIEEGDFTMVYGFPGVTEQYLTSHAVDYVLNIANPMRLDMRETSLSVLNAAMLANEKVDLQYASKQARISNAYKKWIGQSEGLKMNNAVELKLEQEAALREAMNKLENGVAYASIFDLFAKHYERRNKYALAWDLHTEFYHYGPEIVRFSAGFASFFDKLDKAETEEEKKEMIEAKKQAVERFFKNYDAQTDQRVFAELVPKYWSYLDKELFPTELLRLKEKYQSHGENLAAYLFKKSVFANQKDVLSILDNLTKGKIKKLKKDPVYRLAGSILQVNQEVVLPEFRLLYFEGQELMRQYVDIQMRLDSTRKFWPDANGTLRLTYGKVEGSAPRDGMRYEPFTTLEGVIQKANGGGRDFEIPEKLRELYEERDYGNYATKEGELPVCFTGSNHTTGGNSGSPVLNGKGELIGINFDRSWESTMSDILFDPSRCRNIMVDIRYVLFVIDKFGGARHLVEEMEVRQ